MSNCFEWLHAICVGGRVGSSSAPAGGGGGGRVGGLTLGGDVKGGIGGRLS